MTDSTETQIRELEPCDQAVWRELWAAYLAYYKVDLAESVTQSVWDRLVDGKAQIHGLVSVSPQEEIMGFVHYVLHPNTWSDRIVCYLEDMFVVPASRSRGIGRSFIEHLKKAGHENGWSRLYWHTDSENRRARQLYDQVGRLTDYVRYVVEFPR